MSSARPDPAVPVAPAGLAALFARAHPVPPQCVAVPAPDPAALADDAWQRGHAAGTLAARAELVPAEELLAAAVVALRRACTLDTAAVEKPFAALVTALCTAVVGAELRLAPEHVLALIAPALASVRLGEDMVLRLHPLDAALLDMQAQAELPLPVVADAAVARGSVLVEAAQFVVVDSFAARLAEVLENLPCS